MIQITAVHLVGSEHLQHIEDLRWVSVYEPGGSVTGASKTSTRAQMVTYVRSNPGDAFAMNAAGTHLARLEVVEAQPPYVKTAPDTTKSDNLLSLPRF
jgi:hypothetical protein